MGAGAGREGWSNNAFVGYISKNDFYGPFKWAVKQPPPPMMVVEEAMGSHALKPGTSVNWRSITTYNAMLVVVV